MLSDQQREVRRDEGKYVMCILPPSSLVTSIGVLAGRRMTSRGGDEQEDADDDKPLLPSGVGRGTRVWLLDLRCSIPCGQSRAELYSELYLYTFWRSDPTLM